MKKQLKSISFACGVFCILGIVGCGQSAEKPPTTEETKSFQGGGKMTPEEAAAAKKLMAPAAPAPGQPVK